MMARCRDLRIKIRQWAILSRFFLFILHVFINTFVPDHQSDAFVSPAADNTNGVDFCTPLDRIASFLLNGLGHWDGQHFLHIAKHGYTYETNLAFFPLYPAVTKITANTIGFPLRLFFCYDTIVIFSALFVSFVSFVLSAEIFYELSRIVVKEENLAYRSALLYCVNPASIFFSAAYSESLFALCVFFGMFLHEKKSPFKSSISFAIGGSVRSNSIVNVGFSLYQSVLEFFFALRKMSDDKIVVFFARSCRVVFGLLIRLCVVAAPLVAHQIFAYRKFCARDANDIYVSSAVRDYGVQNELRMATDDVKPSWCFSSIPASYNNIQEKYWNVGFLKYYQLKQIPNFLLALPISLLVVCGSARYFVINLKRLFQPKSDHVFNFDKQGIYNPNVFVYVVHGLTILTFGLLFINVQVLTRMLCASSPIVCWFAANATINNVNAIPVGSLSTEETCNKLETAFNLSRWGDNVLLDQIQYWKHHSRTSSIVLAYFLTYFTLGMAMFVNGFPFT